MSLKLSAATVLAALVYLGVELSEGDDPEAVLDSTLDQYGLTRDQFMNEATLFALGYHRGLQVRPFSEDQAPINGDKPDADLITAIENGYAFGLEARDIALTPPPSLVYEAHKAGKVEWGGLAAWAATLELGETRRLAHAIEIGSGKNAVVVPAGTPVDVLGETVKDGVNHVIVSYDGVALLVPNPEDAPRLVAGDEIVKVKATRARGTRKSDGTKAKAKTERRDRGPTLKNAIIDVLEGNDGGPGALQSNGQFAARVMQRARELGIGDKAAKFLQKADKHVPYYINCYKPTKEGYTGRLGFENPKASVIAAIEARKYYLRGDDLSHDERMAQIPAELIEGMKSEEIIQTTPAPATSKKSSKDDDDAGEE